MNDRAGELDWFAIEKQARAIKILPPKKAPGHVLISLDIVRKVPQYHTQWSLDLLNVCLVTPCLPWTWKRPVAV